MRKLPKWFPQGSAIYLATNEDTPHFFDPLKDMYNISSIADFQNLWVEGSDWWKESLPLFPPDDTKPFDGIMEVSRCGRAWWVWLLIHGGLQKKEYKCNNSRTWELIWWDMGVGILGLGHTIGFGCKCNQSEKTEIGDVYQGLGWVWGWRGFNHMRCNLLSINK